MWEVNAHELGVVGDRAGLCWCEVGLPFDC